MKVTVLADKSDQRVWLDFNRQIREELNKYKDVPIWKVSLKNITKQLAAFPQVRDLQLVKSWPRTLEVSYSLPKLMVIHQEQGGSYQLLDEEGHWFGPVKWVSLPNLPWVRGEWVQKKPQLKSSILEFLKELPKTGSLTSEQIAEIQYNDIDGLLVTIIKTGQQIRFGLENYEVKSLRVAQVLEFLQTRGLESRVIDANFSKKVLVRLRNHP